jgi:hypothetical protein
MPFPKCENGYNRRKLTDFAKGVVDDLKGIGKFFNPPRASAYYVPPIIVDCAGAAALQPLEFTVSPYPISIPIRSTGCGFYLEVAQPVDVEVGFYDSTDDGYPNRLLRSKTFTVEESGHIFSDWEPIDLEPGLYWTGIVNYSSVETLPNAGVYQTIGYSRKFEPSPDRWHMCYRVFLSSPQLPNPFPFEAEAVGEWFLCVFVRTSQG